MSVLQAAPHRSQCEPTTLITTNSSPDSRSPLLKRLLQFAPKQWRAIDAETNSAPGRGFDWMPLVVLITVAVVLTMQEYYGQRDTFARLFPRGDFDRFYELKSFAWWTGWRVGGYLLLPMLIIAAIPGQRVSDYYISPRGLLRHWWIYVSLFVVMVPVVYIAATLFPAFNRTYPFYKLANRSLTDLLVWEIMYAMQFLSLEFFFRGFLLQGLRRSFGHAAVFVMIVPYCMIHFSKPLPETLGAIFAGLVLGTIAMRTRSIWGGVFIHVGVAVTMDLIALEDCPPRDSGLPCRGH